MPRCHRLLLTTALGLFLVAALASPLGCGKRESATPEPVVTTGRPLVINFWQPGCPPCRELEPVLARLAEEYEGKVDFIALNVYEDSEKASRYRIMATPTLVFLDHDGNEVSRLLGNHSEDDIRDRIEELLTE